MIYKPDFFALDELVCLEIYHKFGEVAWQFFDNRLLITIDTIRQRIGRVITVNDWQVHGQFTQRGFRCLQCQLVKDAINTGRLYVSPHMTGQAVDFDVEGMVAEEVRQYIIKNQNLWPYPIRLEAGVGWVHMDVRDAEQGKVWLFNA
jgi:hypothetical protein